MIDIQKAVDLLRFYFKTENSLQVKKDEINGSPLSDTQINYLVGKVDRDKKENLESINSVLEELLRFPPSQSRHFDLLKIFETTASYEKSVFIMTKFPEGKSELDEELKRVIKAVRDAVTQAGFIAMMASDKDYHPGLWDNVELFLCGCGRGIAIVESKYKQELNPNISMEWGWMRAMGKPVLYLVEDDFKEERADLIGLIKHNFTWSNPEQPITNVVSNWLNK